MLTEPKTLRANNELTTATGGAPLSSCHEKPLPVSSDVPAAQKYSGDMLNTATFAAAFDGFSSVVWSLNTSSVDPPPLSGTRLMNPTDLTPGIVCRASIMRFCMAVT